MIYNEAYAPWISDPDDPNEAVISSDASEAAAKNIAKMLGIVEVDRSMDGPILKPQSPAPFEPSETDHMHAWSKAIMILDASEALTRDLIERELAGVAGNRMSFGVLDKTVKQLMRQIKSVREEAVKLAFRTVRAKLGNRPIMDHSLDTWARAFAKSDLESINTAIRVGMVNGDDNIEIARKVVGSMAMNGVDGVTEYTRHKIGHLGRAAIREVLN